MKRFLIYFSFAAFLLAFVVIGLGAYTRLKDAGLGCPDWPLCYGQLTVPHQQSEKLQAEAQFPNAIIDEPKAKAEMVHRYFAGTLGLMIVILAIVSFFSKTNYKKLAFVLLLLLCFQALLGMWTVTFKLHPLVVMGHLIFGFSTLATLWWFYLSQRFIGGYTASQFMNPPYKRFALFGLSILVLQIMLGAWTSTNYAALACPDFPKCQGQWLPALDLKNAFHLFQANAQTYEFGVLDNTARVTIHFFHRLFALVTGIALLTLGVLCQRTHDKIIRRLGKMLCVVVLLQIFLGINNIVSHLSLHNAVAHDLMAALLLLTVLSILFFQRHQQNATVTV